MSSPMCAKAGTDANQFIQSTPTAQLARLARRSEDHSARTASLEASSMRARMVLLDMSRGLSMDQATLLEAQSKVLL